MNCKCYKLTFSLLKQAIDQSIKASKVIFKEVVSIIFGRSSYKIYGSVFAYYSLQNLQQMRKQMLHSAATQTKRNASNNYVPFSINYFYSGG